MIEDTFEIPECLMEEDKKWVEEHEENDDIYTDPWDPTHIELHILPSGKHMLIMPFDLPPSVDEFIQNYLTEGVLRIIDDDTPYALSMLGAKLTATLYDLYEKKMLLRNFLSEEDTDNAKEILQGLEGLALQSEKCQECGKDCGREVMRSAAQKYVSSLGDILSIVARDQGLFNTALAAQEFTNYALPISKDLTFISPCTKTDDRLIH